MKTLKSKERIKSNVMGDYHSFYYDDVKEAILQFEIWLESIDYKIDIKKVFDKHKEIFGDFEND